MLVIYEPRNIYACSSVDIFVFNTIQLYYCHDFVMRLQTLNELMNFSSAFCLKGSRNPNIRPTAMLEISQLTLFYIYFDSEIKLCSV